MTTICIHQPDFVPYLGFFHRLLSTDHFIYLDDVQFIRRGWQHRDQVKTKGGATWLTLTLQKGDYHQQIKDVLLSSDGKWIDGNINLIQQSYSKAPYFELVFPRVEAIYRGGHTRMIDFNLAFLNLAMDILGINVRTSFASNYGLTSASSQRLLDLVLAVGGDNYLTGTGSRDYLDEALFKRGGVRVTWQEFKHPVYPQLHGSFMPMLSCLDLFFNCGEHSAQILRGGRRD